MLTIRALLTVLTLGLALTATSACNTFHGMGQDIEAAGEGLSGTADKTKEKMNR